MSKVSRRGFLQIPGEVPQDESGAIGKKQSPLSSTGKPNFIIIFADDMGYGDTTRTGHPTIKTPNLSKMADQGVTMTQFYSAAAVCSPSRAAILTGRYPVRNGIVRVLFPKDEDVGLPDSEKTLPAALKEEGYVNACVGKWHLGHTEGFYPTDRGFDHYYGLLYSNDMADWKDWNDSGEPWATWRSAHDSKKNPPRLMEDGVFLDTKWNEVDITKVYTEKAIDFIENWNQGEDPFFLYLAHTMPHVPLQHSPAFSDSRAGKYGDVIEEIDWSVGQILDKLDDLGLSDNTFVVFTSDNGPWMVKKLSGGSAGLFDGQKTQTLEGGVREPCVIRFPKELGQGEICTEVGTTMDLYTTILGIAGATIEESPDSPVDGEDLLPVLKGQSSNVHGPIHYFAGINLRRVRIGSYKLSILEKDGETSYKLHDVEKDPFERVDYIAHYSGAENLPAELKTVFDELTAEVERISAELLANKENFYTIQKLLSGS